jgi:hypothetical protein
VIQGLEKKLAAAICLLLGLAVLMQAEAARGEPPASVAVGEALPDFCQARTARAALVSAKGISNESPPGGVALLVDRRSVEAGERVYARFANFSNRAAGYGYGFSIEQLAEDWEVDPASPKGPWPMVLLKLHPGEAGSCYAFEVPADQPLGPYRFSTEILSSLDSKRGFSKRFAYFMVRGAKSRFCGKRLLRDYESVFKTLPRLHAPPASGELPFAPSRTYLKQPAESVLLLGEDWDGRFSYGFGAEGDGRQSFSLDWRIEGRLFRVDREGKLVRLVSRAKREVGAISEVELEHLHIGLKVPSRLGLYRASLVFRDEDGQLLGRYGRYLRVLRPSYDVKLAASPRIARAGEVVHLRILNFGTAEIGFGAPYSIERLEESGWVSYPIKLAFHRPLFFLGGGMAGKCQEFTVPQDMPAGRYRFKKDVLGPERSFTAEFEVVP